MDARTVDDAALRLRELREEEWGDLGLAAVAAGLSLLASQLWPELAVPFFAGAAFLAVRGAGAVVRRVELLDRLAADRDAYVITEVRDRALRDAAPDRRRHYAAYVRVALLRPPPGGFGPAAAELEALAAQLEDETLTLDAACAVACERLVNDPYGSPLLNPDLGLDVLRARVRQIRSGFAPRT
jgi:hypothetical protein